MPVKRVLLLLRSVNEIPGLFDDRQGVPVRAVLQKWKWLRSPDMPLCPENEPDDQPRPVYPDPEVELHALAAIKAKLRVSWEQIHLTVKGGSVTIEGTVEWNFQRQIAEDAVRAVKGVDKIRNLVAIAPRAGAAEIRRRIEDEFRCSREIDTNNHRPADDRDRTPEGSVRSWAAGAD
jgi:hypothetical protein